MQAQKPALAKSVILAEQVSSWFKRDQFGRDQPFSDLLELERYLVHLAGMTVLFVESPGSIAELGAFAALDDLRPKTLAVLNEFFGISGSFIADGLLTKIKRDSPDQVLYYNWAPDDLDSQTAAEVFCEMFDDLVAVLELRDSNRHQTEKLDPGSLGHTLLLVADLVRMGLVVERAQLAKCLNILGCEAAAKDLERHLAILECTGLITERRRRSGTYFIRREPVPFVQYGFKGDGKPKDMTRLQSDIRDALDPSLRRILSTYLATEAPNG